MKAVYDPETDTLSIVLSNEAIVESDEAAAEEKIEKEAQDLAKAVGATIVDQTTSRKVISTIPEDENIKG